MYEGGYRVFRMQIAGPRAFLAPAITAGLVSLVVTGFAVTADAPYWATLAVLVVRDDAGTNEAELFAVAVEAFFEQPNKLEKRDPELYSMLREYFNQDTAMLFTR